MGVNVNKSSSAWSARWLLFALNAKKKQDEDEFIICDCKTVQICTSCLKEKYKETVVYGPLDVAPCCSVCELECTKYSCSIKEKILARCKLAECGKYVHNPKKWLCFAPKCPDTQSCDIVRCCKCGAPLEDLLPCTECRDKKELNNFGMTPRTGPHLWVPSDDFIASSMIMMLITNSY
jgi:hypothetical protein